MPVDDPAAVAETVPEKEERMEEGALVLVGNAEMKEPEQVNTFSCLRSKISVE